MARLSAKRVREIARLRDYLVARRVEVKENLNSAKGLTAFIATLDAILRTQIAEPADELRLVDVSGLPCALDYRNELVLVVHSVKAEPCVKVHVPTGDANALINAGELQTPVCDRCALALRLAHPEIAFVPTNGIDECPLCHGGLDANYVVFALPIGFDAPACPCGAPDGAPEHDPSIEHAAECAKAGRHVCDGPNANDLTEDATPDEHGAI